MKDTFSEKNLKDLIIPQFRQTFREMVANTNAADITVRFCGTSQRDPWREIRKLFWSGGRNLEKSLVITKPLVPKKTEKQKKEEKLKYLWLEELSEFEGVKKA